MFEQTLPDFLDLANRNPTVLYLEFCLHQDDHSVATHVLSFESLTCICLGTLRSSLSIISEGLYFLIKTPSHTHIHVRTFSAFSTDNAFSHNSVSSGLISVQICSFNQLFSATRQLQVRKIVSNITSGTLVGFSTDAGHADLHQTLYSVSANGISKLLPSCASVSSSCDSLSPFLARALVPADSGYTSQYLTDGLC